MTAENYSSAWGEIAREQPFSFAKHSSIGCGGAATLALYPTTLEEAVTAINALHSAGTPYRVLGNLTNVLPPDEGYEGVILSTKRLAGVTVGASVSVLAGTTSGELLAACEKESLTGGEFLFGIPCTMGGALYMNAGAGGRYISEIVESVLVWREGELLTLPRAACEYAYKQSVFMRNHDVILGGVLRLEKGTQEEIERSRAYYRDRRSHLPKGRSMGCVFKNPEGRSAGELIEGSGLKGLRLGGVKISERHANFIINEGRGRGSEIRCLISLVKNAVYAQYGVRLQEEIRYI